MKIITKMNPLSGNSEMSRLKKSLILNVIIVISKKPILINWRRNRLPEVKLKSLRRKLMIFPLNLRKTFNISFLC